MFNILADIKNALTIISIVSAIGLGWWGKYQQGVANRAVTNLYSKTEQWTDERGRLVTEVTRLEYTTKELKNISYADSSKLSEAEIKLYEANQSIKDLKLKERNVINYNSAEIESIKDNIRLRPMYANNKLDSIPSINDKNLKVDFNVLPSGDIIANAKYTSTIKTIVSRHRDMETKRGRKRFFVARLVNPRWQYSAINVSDDIDAEITSAVHINFEN